MTFKVAVLSGDGIGPEVMQEALKVLDKVSSRFGIDFEYREALIGGVAIDAKGHAFPDETKEVCDWADAILFGAVGGPKWESLPPEQQPERAALLPIRKRYELFANLRPAIVFPALVESSPLKSEILGDKGFDILVVRELTGGIYFGQPKGIFEEDGKRKGIDTLVYYDWEIGRIAKVAFDVAMKRNKKVASIDKANVLTSMVLWRQVVEEVAKDYPDVELRHLYVDNAAMQLIRDPHQFDVILAGNMFGDILSDEAAMLTGSIGMLPSASLGNSKGLYEPVHGSAPDIAGQGIANPCAMILSAAMMLRYSFNLNEAATAVEKAVEQALNDGLRTADLFRGKPGEKKVSTKEMGDAIVERI
ncbi:3-isopropylmalate dehydrogenase [Thermosulfidibacter takaii ABI70S6]|uniref:3-isopropylmalate dehydrogenase n=1 Tax=Thermosulfidibacter takaii (strain DSM 17441 / JCM 13301 / NBRC 103674 / ABI70S6) TaxID=1298851 RepID=A0A0S3QVA9_THET7|nr:3-isopropylmalate dehydrogenase [Thermosulfidibacter takaii ABI70S6]